MNIFLWKSKYSILSSSGRGRVLAALAAHLRHGAALRRRHRHRELQVRARRAAVCESISSDRGSGCRRCQKLGKTIPPIFEHFPIV